MERIDSKKAPKALGPYSQAIKNQTLIFVSGQLPLDPLTGELVKGDIAQLTKQVMANLKAILEEGNSSFDQVVRCEVFLTDLKDFKAMNEEYAKYFNKTSPPARQTIQVSGLPMGSPIEISCIAFI